MSWGDAYDQQGAAITYSWTPSSQLISQLVNQGISRYTLINEWRPRFIQLMESEGRRGEQWDELFLQFITQYHQPANLAASVPSLNRGLVGSSAHNSPQRNAAMTDDWQPSVEMLKLIGDTICPNGDYIKAQLISFTSHFYGQHHPNWDQKFRQWINNGWNVYGHKKNYTKPEEKGFIDKHTDRSWRDGL